MVQQSFESLVVDVLHEAQKLGGREWSELSADCKPIGDLEGFDSLTAVEATVMIEEKLGCDLELDSVFVSENGKRALTIKEICEQLAKKLERRNQ
jgi:acyl carrier protein